MMKLKKKKKTQTKYEEKTTKGILWKLRGSCMKIKEEKENRRKYIDKRLLAPN